MISGWISADKHTFGIYFRWKTWLWCASSPAYYRACKFLSLISKGLLPFQTNIARHQNMTEKVSQRLKNSKIAAWTSVWGHPFFWPEHNSCTMSLLVTLNRLSFDESVRAFAKVQSPVFYHPNIPSSSSKPSSFSLLSLQIVFTIMVKSRFDELPVTGSPEGLKILPGSEKWEPSKCSL